MTALIAIVAFVLHALWHALPFALVALVAWWRRPTEPEKETQ